MENYVRVRQPRPEEDNAAENEVRITSGGKARSYIAYAHSLLEEKAQSTIVLRAMGKAINKTVAIAEIIKRRVPGLHQATATSSAELTDVWEPKEGAAGLDRIETVRHVSVITITLSKEALDAGAVGYQAPLPAEEVVPIEDEAALAGEGEGDEGRPRRTGGRRGRGQGRGRGRVAAAGEEGDGGEARRGGRRGRGGRGGRKPAEGGGEGGGDAGGDAPAAE